MSSSASRAVKHAVTEQLRLSADLSERLMPTKSLILLYHYFHPDDVISARLFSELAVEMTKAGYEVTAMPSVRSCHDGKSKFPNREMWEGGKIHRVWRPAWRQSSNRGRFGNAVAVLLGWTWRAVFAPRRGQECVVIGTDPLLAVLVAIPWRFFRPRARIVHWCHDLYPQAAIADGLLRADSWIVRVLNRLLRAAYRRCDVIADLGACMRHQLSLACGFGSQEQETAAKRADALTEPSPCEALPRAESVSGTTLTTLTPWALVEPKQVVSPDLRVRRELFGDGQLGLLYSGNLGRAHRFDLFVELARQLRGDAITFCYAGRGPKMSELRAAVTPLDENMRFAGFASEEELELRLGAADVHMVSLDENWTGSVLPSKFFASLAIGRPVLFLGSSSCAIARWIEGFKIGWVINRGNVSAIAERLRELAADSSTRCNLNQRCFEVYQEVFSKQKQMARWHECLGSYR